MNKLETIQRAITDLSPELSAEDFAKLRAFLDELEADVWDARIERDAAAGKLDWLVEEAIAEYESGATVKLDGTPAHHFSSRFVQAYSQLPEDIQRETSEFFERLRTEPIDTAPSSNKPGSN